MLIPIIIAVVVTLIVVMPVTYFVTVSKLKNDANSKIGNADVKAREIIDDAVKTAEAKKKESLLEIKEESIKNKNELEKETKERRAELQRYEKRVLSKEEALDKKADAIEKREAGFTAKELLTALAVALVRFQEGKPFFVNCYPRVVTREGSREAQRLVNELMEGCDSEWRGLGIIPGSGMQLREEWEAYDARKKYNMPKIEGKANPACRCGDVLQGKCKPSDCKVFGKVCTPQHPVGACMVSGEGACSAYYMYDTRG